MEESNKKTSTIVPNWEFAKLATDDQIERAAKALVEDVIHTRIAQHGEEAEKMLFD